MMIPFAGWCGDGDTATTQRAGEWVKTMAKRVCSVPGCPELTDGGRCKTHRSDQERGRGTRQARGYDATHQRLRAAYAARMAAGEVFVCWRPGCGTVIDPDHWHLGHDDHDRSRYRGPECPPCNLRAGGRAAHSA